jgi:hypothetical protein
VIFFAQSKELNNASKESSDNVSNYSTSLQNVLMGEDHNLEEEHESNGPKGAREIPMQRLSLKGFALLLALMTASTSVLLIKSKDIPSGVGGNG